MLDAFGKIQDKLSKAGNSQKAIWLENYVKHNIRSRGVGIPEIRKIVIEVSNEFKITTQSSSQQVQLLNLLMQQPYTEDKLAAILIVQLYWKGVDCNRQLEVFSKWFENRWISDWNVCDWLCVRLISPLINNNPECTIRELIDWNRDEYLWKARASLVPFAQCKSIELHKHVVESFSTQLIKRPERFCKTSVGWVLREYSRFNKDFVLTFFELYKDFVTKEVVRNATKYIIP